MKWTDRPTRAQKVITHAELSMCMQVLVQHGVKISLDGGTLTCSLLSEQS